MPFETNPFCHASTKFYMSIKDLEILAAFNLLQKLHLCTHKSVCATNLGPLGEIGANFSLQFSSRTHFAKINSEKVIAENQGENHKKSSLAQSIFELCAISFVSSECVNLIRLQ